MSDAQGGTGRREVAHRLFATEFEDADLSYSESDEERAPNYVVTPTGARVNRVFVVGVLTEVEQVSDGVLRGRVVDPTGAFVVYAGQYQPDEMAFLEAANPPSFVAVTGKARTFQPDDSDRVFTSVRPESITDVDAETRDRWTVQAAEQTLDRIAVVAGALERSERGDELGAVLAEAGTDDALAAGVPIALDHYGTAPAYLDALRETALDAARIVAGERDDIGAPDRAPDEPGDVPLAPLQEAGVDVEPVSVESELSDQAVPTETETATDTDETTASTDPVDETETTATSTETEPSTTETEAMAGVEETETTVGVEETETTETNTPAVDVGTETDPGTTADDADTGTADVDLDDDLGDFDPGEYELEEETREQIEEEYGTEFQTGAEVDEPGTADIEPTEPADDETVDDETVDDETVDETTETADTEPPEEAVEDEPEEPTSDDESADNGDGGADELTAPDDLQEAVVDLMNELDDGSGADRAALFDEMATRYGSDQAAVEDAVQDALMDGECYEPDDETLKPI